MPCLTTSSDTSTGVLPGFPSAATLTLDALRDSVVRSARRARALAVEPEALLAALPAHVRDALAALRPARRAELLARVHWWAIHGYYGE